MSRDADQNSDVVLFTLFSFFIFILFYDQRFPELQDVHSLFRAAAFGVCVATTGRGVWKDSGTFFLI